MTVLDQLRESIRSIGVKEIARRAGLAASTVSRVNSGQIQPSLEIFEKMSAAVGLRLNLSVDRHGTASPRLIFAKRVLGELKKDLKKYGVQHAFLFGSVARGDHRPDSDTDVFLDFGDIKPSVTNLLAAEGKVLDAFGAHDVDIVSQLESARGRKLKLKIDTEGVRVF